VHPRQKQDSLSKSRRIGDAAISATADSSCGELTEALQRNAKHEARLSNISGLFPFGNIETN
jgi:hypothetical protein